VKISVSVITFSKFPPHLANVCKLFTQVLCTQSFNLKCFLLKEGIPPSDIDGTLTPDTDRLDSPPLGLNIRGATSSGRPGQVSTLKTLRVGRKDLKKGGTGLRGKNVTEAFRVKDKDLKRTMK